MLDKKDKDFLVDTLANRAIQSGKPDDFFMAVWLDADLPPNWQADYLAQLKINPRHSAQFITQWAIGMEENTKDRRFTTLGSLLYPMLANVGGDTVRRLVVIIVSNRLIRDEQILIELMKQYNVPFPTIGTSGDIGGLAIAPAPSKDVKVGPDIDWRGPEGVELQSFNWFQPDYMDGGFLMRATDRARSVCQVRVPQKQKGTGFLIGPNLLITNYHVLESPDIPGDNKDENAKNVVVVFNYTSTADGEESEGLEFRLAGDTPILASSPVPELDFVLLRVEDKITTVEGIKALTYKTDSSPDRSLNIIQHPHGGPLMFAFSSNGITGVYDDGRIQYSSKAAGGSSGAPCFNDKWNLVAIHHAERSTWTGVRREGIQFSHIYSRIKDHLG